MKTLLYTSIVVFTLVIVGFTVNDAFGAVFAKYDGIDGESKDAKHDKWIDILSVDWGAHTLGGDATGQSRRRGGAVVEDMTLTIEYEKASPKLQEKMLMGEVIPKLEIELTATYGGSRATYLKYELTNVMITSFQKQASGNDNAGPATVVIGNNFEEIKVTYTEYDEAGSSKGNVETEWNVVTGTSDSKSPSPPPPIPPTGTDEGSEPPPPTGPTGDGSEEPPTEMQTEEPPKEEDTTPPTQEEQETADEITRLPASEVAKLSREKLAKITPRVFKELPKSTARNLSPDGIQGLPDDTVKSLTPKQLKKLAPSTIRGLEPGLVEKLPAQTKQILSPKIDQFPMKIPKSTILQQGIPGQERYGFKLPKLFIAPYAQLLTGVSAEDIVCNEGFELVMKTSNEKPACVISSSVDKLVERGWATK